MQINLRWGHFGSYFTFDCTTGFTHANLGAPLICNPTTGQWVGEYNPYTLQVCLPPGPPAPTGVTASVISPTSARVTWSPPSVTTGITYYEVEAAADPYLVERFGSIRGPSDMSTAWLWSDPKATSHYSFPNGQVRIDAAPSSDCSAATPLNCPHLSRSWPEGVRGDDFAVEAWVAFDSNVVQNTQFAGIGLVQDNAWAGANNTLMLWAGLYRSGSDWRLQWATGTFTFYSEAVLTNPIYGAWFRIERIAGSTGPSWSYFTNPSTYRAAYRTNIDADWSYLPLPPGHAPITDLDLPNGVGQPVGLDPAHVRAAVLLRNANSGQRASVLADNLRIGSRTCLNAGNVRMMPPGTTSAIVSGLSPGGSYRFAVTSGSAAIVGGSSAPSAPIVLPTAVPTPSPPLTGNIALGRTAIMTGRYSPTNFGPEMGVDGIKDSGNFFHTRSPGSQGPCSDAGCWWQVDLGVQVREQARNNV